MADLVVGVADLAATLGGRGVVAVRAVAGPALVALGRRAAYPPLVPAAVAPGPAVARLASRGAERRRELGRRAVGSARALVPVVVDRVLDELDLTRLVLDRVDLAVVVTVALDELDLTEVVTGRVDLGRVVSAALGALDLTDVVLTQVDLGQVVAAALDDLDLTATVLDRVDLHRVVMQVLDGLDLTALVRDRVDLDALANEVIEDVDLPEIIRESSTGIATDMVVEARTGAASADEAVARVVDRILLRRRRQSAGTR
ncbi:hypothetical protein [Mumia flava]|uniref:hypothetical protein n=1 Tax=Mumia flava TaxID=1348852 RepID=UPI0012FD9CE5|nr:hypothetical protein [Mumia flava]